MDWSKSDIPIENWSQLVTALHSEAVIPVQDGQGGHFRSPFVFRGMSVASWELKTSLQRLKTFPTVVEDALLRSFKKYARIGTISDDSEWEVLSIAQHNGLPTRVLDWSVSPLVAAHFATCEKNYFNEDGVIWCVDVMALRDNILPKVISQPLRKIKAAIYDVRLLDQVFDNLYGFDEALKDDEDEAVVFFEPPSIDARIQNQFGILSIMNGSERSHQDYFEKIAIQFPQAIQRVIIKSHAKPQIRDMLDQNNITERMLFPGLPGLCDWLRRYYGPV